MKKILSVLSFLVFLSSPLLAQQVVQQDIDVNAHVIAKLSIVSSQNVDMGTIVTGSISTLGANASSNAQPLNPGVGATPGQIVVSGASGERISVVYNQAVLSNVSGNTTTFLPSVYNGSTQVVSGNEVTLSGSGSGSSQITLDIGGSLLAIPDGNEGTYSTSNTGGTPITFTFTYTSI